MRALRRNRVRRHTDWSRLQYDVHFPPLACVDQMRLAFEELLAGLILKTGSVMIDNHWKSY